MRLLGQLIRRLVVGWSLERKSLLFFGLALVIPISLAFWFVVQVVAERLVMQTTRQAARDYARGVIAWRHVDKRSVIGPAEVFNNDGTVLAPAVLSILRADLVDNPEYQYDFLMLDEPIAHTDLSHANPPDGPEEEQILEGLHVEFRERLAKAFRDDQPTDSGAVANSEDIEGDAPPPPGSLLQISNDMFREDGPVFTSGGPSEGWYVYYHAIQFPESCLICHHRYPSSDAADTPYRVVKVMIPYEQTQVASAATLAVMIAVGMVTISVTLLIVHFILRRLVLNPLRHLRSVSDEISRGNTDLRANIDTGDEFNELGDAFNRMIRHLTESQAKLQKLNSELDIRVDQLAQANLHLYEANRLKSDFLANMSHELRTPLNSIIGFSDVLKDIDSLTVKQKRYANNIQKSGQLLLEMINDILDLAKMEAGKLEVAASTFSPEQVVRAQCDMLRSLTDEKNMDLKIDCEHAPQTVFQDQSKLQQILTNLLSNAIKFTPDGGIVTVTLSMLPGLDSNNGYFHITVADTGVGIPQSDFEVIFEKFRQSNAILQNDGLTRQYSGTGLGLSIVKELCKLLGGEIRLSSQLGTGSTFQVILPVHYTERGQKTELLTSTS